MMGEIEKLLELDNREKKKAGRGIFKRTASRRGGAKGGWRVPSTYDKNMQKPGEVTITMYLPTWDEMMSMDAAKQRETYLLLKREFSVKQLNAAWREAAALSYPADKLYRLYGSPLPSRKKGEGGGWREPGAELSERAPEFAGMRINLKDKLSGEGVGDRLTNIGSILSKDTVYMVTVTIEEVGKVYED